MTTEYSSRNRQEDYTPEPVPEDRRRQELQQLRYRVIELADHNQQGMQAEANHFMERFLNRELTQQDALNFVSDTWGNQRLPEEDRTALELLNQQSKLSDGQMDRYIGLLVKGHQAAMDTLAYSPISPPEQGWKIEEALNQACMNAVREKSVDYPFPSIGSAGPETSMSFNELAKLRLEGMDDRPENLDLYEKAIYRTHQHAAKYSKSGEPPHWFDPETMTVSTEMWQQGYNPVNNGSIDPKASLEQLADQIQLRMNLLGQTDPSDPGLSQRELTRMIFRPMLDQEFMRDADHYDPPNAYYSPDTPHMEPNTEPYPGDSADPHRQAAASFGHALRERMALTGLAETTSSTQLAWQIQYNLPALQNLADWGREAASHNLTDPATGALDPPLKWNSGTQANWQAIADATANGSDPDALGRLATSYQERALQALTKFNTVHDYQQETRYINRYDVRPEENGQDENHPHNALLREAMYALNDVRSSMHRVHELVNVQEAPANPWDSRHTALASESHAMNPMAEQALREMDPDAAANLLAETGSAAAIGYYATALKQLTHADFIISNVQRQQNENSAD